MAAPAPPDRRHALIGQRLADGPGVLVLGVVVCAGRIIPGRCSS